MDEQLETIIQAAEKGGRVLKKYFGQDLATKEKSTVVDFQTKADIESEQAILQIILARFPDYNVMAEESGFVDKKSAYTFYIDPLDGSNNFVSNLPLFTVSIALLKEETTIFAIIHHPITNLNYYAIKGVGAFLNGERISVNQEKNPSRARIGFHYGYKFPKDGILRHMQTFNSKIARMFFNWSPTFDFSLLASGKIEGIVSNGPEIHDYIGGKLIAKEAGAVITDFNGEKEKSEKSSIFVISNGTEIHKEILKLL
jgi:myo-inositol-1(or 4)-monophosphatase